MNRSGGSVALTGFLYQLLHHVYLIAELRLTKRGHSTVQVVFEPITGGDSHLVEPDYLCVEQYKTRSKRTWAVLDMIGVLSNLRRAVQLSQKTVADYRFITNGRRGRFKEFDAFLVRIQRANSIDDLDDVTVRKFSISVNTTDREFFQYIERKTRKKGVQSCSESYAEVFHLLSRFDMQFCITTEDLILKIDEKLRRYVADRGDEVGIRQRLIAELISRLESGPLRLDRTAIVALFNELELSPMRVEAFERLQQTMKLITTTRLTRHNYVPALDVRSQPEWHTDKPVLLIAGKSGVGKTWQLGSLLCSLMDKQKVVTVVSGTGSGEEQLSCAVRDIWQIGLGETSVKTMVALLHHLNDLGFSSHQLVLAFEDVRDTSTARYLIDQDWSILGVRIVLTVSNDVALSFLDAHEVQLHPVKEFSYQELGKVLTPTIRYWEDLPHDLLEILRTPILAGIFLSLKYSSFQRSPQSEYEIFERYWHRIKTKAWSTDVGTVMALGLHCFKSKPYPIPQQSWSSIQLNDNKLSRLEIAGWFQHNCGYVSFVHDRLLNWALAESFVNAYLVDQIPLSELGDSLAKCVEGTLMYGYAELGYVPLDVFWLLAQDAKGLAILPHLIEHLEECVEFGSYGQVLYTQLLPTLGRCAVPILLQRLRKVAKHDEHDHRFTLISAGMVVIQNQQDVDLEDVLLVLLDSISIGSQNVALKMLSKSPTINTLDRVWRLHKQRLKRLNTESDTWIHEDYQASFDALGATIKLKPDWLRSRIVCNDELPEHLPALTYQLSILEDSNEHRIWNDTKKSLMERTPNSKPQSVLRCIERFTDRECIDFVLKHVTSKEEHINSVAFSTLAVIDPVLTLQHLGDIDDVGLYVSRKRWLPILLFKQPELTRQRIFALAETNSWGCMKIRLLFHEIPNELDRPLLEFFLVALEKELTELLDQTVASVQTSWFATLFDFLHKMTHPKLLAVIETKKHSKLEYMITQVAINLTDRFSGSSDVRVFEYAYHILMNIAGGGLAKLIRYQLASNHQILRIAALRWTLISGDREVVQYILDNLPYRVRDVELTARDIEEIYELITLLAQLGEDEALVNVLQEFGQKVMTDQLPWLRHHLGPMSKHVTVNARNILISSEETEERTIAALCVAWVSGDPDMIPLVRSKLRGAQPSSLVAKFACFGLEALGDVSGEFLELAYPLLDHDVNAQVALRAISNAAEVGIPFISRWLENVDLGNHGIRHVVVSAIRLIHQDRETKALAVNTALKICRDPNQLFDLPFEIAAESHDDSLYEHLFKKVFDPNPLDSPHMLRAIQALARYDNAKAVRAAENAIRNGPVNRDLCILYTVIAHETAVKFLVFTAVTTERTILRRCIGRVLRRLDTSYVSDLVISYLQEGNAKHREAAADVGRWLLNSRIKEVLVDRANSDVSSNVRLSALTAITAHEKEAIVRQLLSVLNESPEQRRWTILVAVLTAGDPICFSIETMHWHYTELYQNFRRASRDMQKLNSMIS